MRLDHLLSMETMRSFHGDLGVDLTREVLSGSWYGTFVVQFSRIRNSLTVVMIIEKEQPVDTGV